ncbi:hypothetical protein M501DRAFT_1004419 [Patellaria atrata CBS 101060]|uniref:Uncharacterized protein n=1 Tax=Patellaria atrata CBS 101060 TaxID=1346257 RepID=A0A9P4SBL3_9PEZI|nr:hypothetical protein M501DRAFT_1004419 [Patellaria atrata CBS 101060]
MTDYPALQPAFTVRVLIDAPFQIGSASKGTPLSVVPMVGGTVKSEPGFEPAIEAELHGVGYDYIHNDASGEHMRLDVRSQLRDKDGALLAMYYQGNVVLTPAVVKVLTGSSDAETTPWGDSFVTFQFETGSSKFKSLETMVFVAAGRFIFEDGKITVEYKVSKVVKG